MKVLIVGSGGREHALAWKCAQSPKVSEVLVAPGNGGTATEPRVRNVNVAAEDVPGLVALAKQERVGLTIIGPEAPLVIGVVDAFQAAHGEFRPLSAATLLAAQRIALDTGERLRLWPHLHGTDGFFAAIFERTAAS